MRNFFYGWYFKCQSATQTLAVIPAVHKSEQKKLFHSDHYGTSFMES